MIQRLDQQYEIETIMETMFVTTGLQNCVDLMATWQLLDVSTNEAVFELKAFDATQIENAHD